MAKPEAFLLVLLATSYYFLYVIGETSFKVISCSHYQKKFVQRKQICSIRVSPLCASNNVTYPNSCVYCFANVALNLTLQIQYSGKCLKSTS
uniref:Predicted gene, 36368 n=2 Tax=Mus TaxID=862507 RepID=A0A1D5RLK8_MOUSE